MSEQRIMDFEERKRLHHQFLYDPILRYFDHLTMRITTVAPYRLLWSMEDKSMKTELLEPYKTEIESIDKERNDYIKKKYPTLL